MVHCGTITICVHVSLAILYLQLLPWDSGIFKALAECLGPVVSEHPFSQIKHRTGETQARSLSTTHGCHERFGDVTQHVWQQFSCKVSPSVLGSKPYPTRLERGHTLLHRAIKDALKISYKGVVSLQLHNCTLDSYVMMLWCNQGIGKVFNPTELQPIIFSW